MISLAYMATGILFGIGLTLEEVVAIRDKAKAAMLAGAVTVTSSIGEVSFGKQIPQNMSPMELLAECKMFLQQTDPDTYGHRVTKLRSDFSNG